jgi:hypothetical protein
MERAHDTDLDFGTASFSCMAWVKTTSMSSDFDIIFQNEDTSGATARQFALRWEADGALGFQIGDGASTKLADTGVAFDDGAWHFVVGIKESTTDCHIYVDGVLLNSVGSGLSNTLTDSNAVFRIGRAPQGGAGASAGRPNANGSTALVRISTTIPTATQIRQMYDAEKPMFVASAKCLLQSGSTDAVLDVDIDAITGFVTVVQTDDETVWDGLAIHSEPTIPTGGTTWEHSVRHGGAAFTITDANFAGDVPAIGVRDVASEVQGLMGKLPAGVDLGKAKAWLFYDQTGTAAIRASYNIKSVTDVGTGRAKVVFGIPFKTAYYSVSGSSARNHLLGVQTSAGGAGGWFADRIEEVRIVHDDVLTDADWSIVIFGELENE